MINNLFTFVLSTKEIDLIYIEQYAQHIICISNANALDNKGHVQLLLLISLKKDQFLF